MASPAGELLTRWTARIAVGCFAAAILVRLASRPHSEPTPEDRETRTFGPARDAGGRWLWTIGCAVYLVHVACAFGFYHGWSHGAAFEHTAQRTRETIGVDWGGGLYANYVFTAAWVGDVLLAWRSGRGGRPSQFVRRMRIAIGVVLAFLVVNATVVFGPVFWRWLAAALLPALLWLALRRKALGRRSRRAGTP